MIKYLYKGKPSLHLPLSPHLMLCMFIVHLTTHAIVVEANSFTEKMIAIKTVGQMDLYVEHFKYT